MAQSLLAHMYSHIRGSQEDIATYSLEYLISRSTELNEAFTRLLEKSLCSSIGGSIRYSCQSVGDNLERPDISGVNSEGHEVVLCEAKFYAGLTENQPNGYLHRLKSEGGIGLVFICPEVRKKNLWSKLVELCNDGPCEEIDEYCVSVDGVRMSIITWSEIIDALKQKDLSAIQSMRSDIDQLEGFCRLMDEGAFIPFSKEDFGPEYARREERYYQVADAVVDHMLANKSLNASTSGLRATPYKQGYARYINVLGHSASINYDRSNWWNPNTEDTPFWTVIYEPGFRQPNEYNQVFNKYPASYKGTTNNSVALPLFALTGATLDEVAKDLMEQMIDYIQVIDKTVK